MSLRRRIQGHAHVFLLLPLLAGCAGAPSAPPAPDRPPQLEKIPDVRVALLAQANDIQVGSTDAYSMMDDDGVLVVGSESEIFSVHREGDRVLVYTPGGELLDSVEGRLRVEPRSEAGEVTVNGARYPHRLEIIPSPKGGLNVVNVVGVETYLRGVVPLEIGHQDPGLLEAAKAQAVAARTYVAGHMNQFPEEGFDLYAGVTDQVYGPVDRRHPSADEAVWQTRGTILTYKGTPITANYSSTCGGRTAAAEESFETDPIPYLKSQKDEVDGEVACRSSKVFRWDETWTGDEFRDALARTVPRVLGVPWKGAWIRNVEVVETGKSGRVVKLRVETDQGVYDLEKGAMRQVMENTSGRPLRSTAFEVELWRSGDRLRMLVLHGKGWGHGVGMCQWGAMQLSRDGHSYRKILEHYYPETDLTPWYSPRAVSDARSEGRDRVLAGNPEKGSRQCLE